MGMIILCGPYWPSNQSGPATKIYRALFLTSTLAFSLQELIPMWMKPSSKAYGRDYAGWLCNWVHNVYGRRLPEHIKALLEVNVKSGSCLLEDCKNLLKEVQDCIISHIFRVEGYTKICGFDPSLHQINGSRMIILIGNRAFVQICESHWWDCQASVAPPFPPHLHPPPLVMKRNSFNFHSKAWAGRPHIRSPNYHNFEGTQGGREDISSDDVVICHFSERWSLVISLIFAI